MSDLVHWLDDNGKHELGRVVTTPNGQVVDLLVPFILVQPLNAPCGHAVWVEQSKLTPYTGAKGTSRAWNAMVSEHETMRVLKDTLEIETP